MNIFKKASEMKLRFTSNRGELTTEQLWELPLTSQTKANLNDVAITISHNIKEVIDFVGNSTNTNSTETLKLEIVKEIIADKKKAISDKADKFKRTQEIEKLEEILERKEDASTEKMSKKDIKAKIEELKA